MLKIHRAVSEPPNANVAAINVRPVKVAANVLEKGIVTASVLLLNEVQTEARAATVVFRALKVVIAVATEARLRVVIVVQINADPVATVPENEPPVAIEVQETEVRSVVPAQVARAIEVQAASCECSR